MTMPEHTPPTAAELAAWKAATEAATVETWTVAYLGVGAEKAQTFHRAASIAMPRLLAEVERLQALSDAWRTAYNARAALQFHHATCESCQSDSDDAPDCVEWGNLMADAMRTLKAAEGHEKPAAFADSITDEAAR